MARRTMSLGRSHARPANEDPPTQDERIDQLEAGLTAPPVVEAAPKKAKRGKKPDRAKMTRATVHFDPTAHKKLKMHILGLDEGLEEFILKAVNERLVATGAEFLVTDFSEPSAQEDA
ncbi:MAG: hypothetical protein AAFR68_18420 [Pseudomonadota bacterium]